MNRWRFDRLIGLIFGMLIMGATTGALATSNGGNSHQSVAPSAPALSYTYSDPAGCLPGDLRCFVIDEVQSPNRAPQVLVRRDDGVFISIGDACPTDPRNVALDFVLGSDPNGWSGPIQEGSVKVYTYHGGKAVLARVAYGRLDTGRGTVTVNTRPIFFQDGSWRCLSLGNSTIPLPGEPSITKSLTIGEVASWCSNCAGSFDVIYEGDSIAIAYTAANLGTCPAGFDMPAPVKYQAATINGQYDGQVEAQNVLVTRVCKATFRLGAIRI